MDHKTVLITGASRGLGLSLAQEVLSRGYTVFATCRHPESATLLQELAEVQQPNRLTVIAMDVCDPASVEMARQRVSRVANSLDLLISNAGINLAAGFDVSASRGPLAALDPNALGELFKTNALGNLNVLKAFQPLLAASSRSVIVCISSDRASIGSAGRESIGYSISKAALNMLVRKLAPELGDAGIKIVAVHPGWLRTDMGGPAAPVDPHVAANKIANLAEKADYPTGSFLTSDGTELPW